MQQMNCYLGSDFYLTLCIHDKIINEAWKLLCIWSDWLGKEWVAPF